MCVERKDDEILKNFNFITVNFLKSESQNLRSKMHTLIRYSSKETKHFHPPKLSEKSNIHVNVDKIEIKFISLTSD